MAWRAARQAALNRYATVWREINKRKTKKQYRDFKETSQTDLLNWWSIGVTGLNDDIVLVNCVPGFLVLIQECSRLDHFNGWSCYPYDDLLKAFLRYLAELMF